MNEHWIVRLDRRQASQLARLRGVAGLEVAETADALWLRAPAGEPMDRLLRTLDGQRYQPAAGDQLVCWGKRVPSERLPQVQWQSLPVWATIALPVAALPGRLFDRARLRLVRERCEQQPSALVTDCNRWLDYATVLVQRELEFRSAIVTQSGSASCEEVRGILPRRFIALAPKPEWGKERSEGVLRPDSGFGSWSGARVAPLRCPILRPGRLTS